MNTTLDCPTARERLSARLDGEHDADLVSERALLLHLAGCTECRAHEEALAGLAPAWRALREVAPPADLWERIERRVPARRVRPAPALARVAAALVGFLTLGGAALLLEKREARSPAPPAHVLERWLASVAPRAGHEDSLAFLAALPEYRLLRALPRSAETGGKGTR